MSLKVRIDRASAKWKNAFPRMNAKMEEAALRAFRKAEKPAAFRARKFETTIILADDKTIRALNRDYRGKDKPTNVLSFPQFSLAPPSPALRERAGVRVSGRKSKSRVVERHPHPNPLPQGGRGNIPLGDIVLAYETIRRECRIQKKTPENHAIHLVVHGLLHLLGYDHMRLKDAKIMECLECDILAGLGYNDPYHETETTRVGA
jgi:probable rRNA maturation factor